MRRKERITYKFMPNGNIRAFDISSRDKRGITEGMIVNNIENIAFTLTTRPPLIIYCVRKKL